MFYAFVSLCQLVDKDEKGAIWLRATQIADWPEMGLRLAKTSASTLPLPALREFAAWMPLYKMNVMGLQYHGTNSNEPGTFAENVRTICNQERQRGVLETIVYFCPFRGKGCDFNSAEDR